MDFKRTGYLSLSILISVFLAAAGVSTSKLVEAKVYKWTDENGKVHYSDKPPYNKKRTQMLDIQAEQKRFEKVKLEEPGNQQVLNIRSAFKLNNFASIDRILGGLQQQYLVDISAEEQLENAYKAFQISGEHYEKKFGLWLTQIPDSYQAYLARAYFYFHRGWVERGNKSATKTSSAQFEKMNFYLKKSQSDIEASLRLNNQSTAAYALAIRIANSAGNSTAERTWLKKGLTINPASYLVRKAYIDALQPRWGGSFIKMAAFAQESQKYAAKNPKLMSLSFYHFIQAAQVAYDKKNYKSAIALLDKAIGVSESARSYYLKGKSYYFLKDYGRALDDLNQAIHLKPTVARYFYWRSWANYRLDKRKAAFEDIKSAYALDPDDELIQKRRDKVFAQLEPSNSQKISQSDYQKSLKLINDSIAKYPDNPHFLFKKAQLEFSQKRFESTEILIKRAILIKDDEFEFYRVLDLALFNQGKLQEILTHWKSYLKIKPNDNRAYLERAGTYYHLQDYIRAKKDAKKAMELGNPKASSFYQKLSKLAGNAISD